MYNYWVVQLVLSAFVATSIAYPYKNNYHDVRDNYDPKDVRNLDGIGGGNLLRDLDMLRNRAEMYERHARNLDSLAGITLGGEKRSWGDNYIGSDKRNLDEIDHAGFDSFVKKRSFDEIDHAGFITFPNSKRNIDEIDRQGFGTFIKRSAPAPPSSK